MFDDSDRRTFVYIFISKAQMSRIFYIIQVDFVNSFLHDFPKRYVISPWSHFHANELFKGGTIERLVLQVQLLAASVQDSYAPHRCTNTHG